MWKLVASGLDETGMDYFRRVFRDYGGEFQENGDKYDFYARFENEAVYTETVTGMMAVFANRKV